MGFTIGLTFYLVLLSYIFWPGTLGAEEIDHRAEYRRCMSLAAEKPDKGFEVAIAWRGLGGGDAAEHCTAVSLLELKHYDEAAKRFEFLAQNTVAEPEFRAQLLGQAAQAWLLSGKLQRAENVATAALRLAPMEIDLLIDRAQVSAARSDHGRSIVDLNKVLDQNPNHADALVFRASALRLSGKNSVAAIDVDRALAIEPEHPEGLLERGILRRLLKDKIGARADWLQVIVTSPGTVAAESARTNLQRMDDPPQKNIKKATD